MRAPDDFKPRVPDGISVIAIGDVHGCLDKLLPILTHAEQRATRFPGHRHVIVSIGNLIDRGPNSADVIERFVKGVAGCQTVALRGDHEQMMLDFLDGESADTWLCNGGFDTLLSYGLDLHSIVAERPGPDGMRQALVEVLPADHLHLLKQTAYSFECGDYYFVHAGVRPGTPLDQQAPEDLLSIREEFLQHRRPFAKKIVHGHTPVKVPTFNANRINLDTGACFGGPLTALLLEGDQVMPFI